MKTIDVVNQCIKNKIAMKKKLLCFSKDDFEELMDKNQWTDESVPNDVAIISIGEPEAYSQNKHWFKENHENVLNIDFFDIDFTEFFSIVAHKKESKGIKMVSSYERTYIEQYHEEKQTAYTYECFNHQQAETVVRFILKNIGKDFYIHCHAGISRSQAVVMFILTHFIKHYDYTSLNQKNLPKIPNQWVLDCLNYVYTENKVLLVDGKDLL